MGKLVWGKVVVWGRRGHRQLNHSSKQAQQLPAVGGAMIGRS